MVLCVTHPIFGTYTVKTHPYKITFADGTEYTRREAEYMAKLPDEEKKQMHQIKQIFKGEIYE